MTESGGSCILKKYKCTQRENKALRWRRRVIKTGILQLATEGEQNVLQHIIAGMYLNAETLLLY